MANQYQQYQPQAWGGPAGPQPQPQVFVPNQVCLFDHVLTRAMTCTSYMTQFILILFVSLLENILNILLPFRCT